MIRHDNFERSTKDLSSNVPGTSLNFSRGVKVTVGEADWSSRQQSFASNTDAVYLPRSEMSMHSKQSQINAFVPQHQHQNQNQHQQKQPQSNQQIQQQMQASLGAVDNSLNIPSFGNESGRTGSLKPTNTNNLTKNHSIGSSSAGSNIYSSGPSSRYGQRSVVSLLQPGFDESKEAKCSPVPSSDTSHGSFQSTSIPTNIQANANSTVKSVLTNFDMQKDIPIRDKTMNILSPSSNDKPDAIYFAFYIPSGQARQNEKTMKQDILFNVHIKIYSHNDEPSNIQTVHSTFKWFSEIKFIHDSLGFLHNIQLPMFQVRGENNQVTDNEIALAQHYLNSLADTYLNQDMRSEQSINILDTFDDETHTLHDKIRMLMLEKSFIHTVFKNNRLENELYATKKHLTETQTAIAQLCWKVDQLTGGGSVMRQSDPVTPNVFSQSPSSPVINSASLYYPNSQLTIPVSNGQKTQDIIIEFPEIDPNTLVNIAESILLEKGPLPVGEVGKMLQERTKNLQLSQMLKEKHNGLKKFLEKYADRFIMSSDHPFNPHVYLRRCFSPDKQRDIENGSKAFLEEFKKNKKTRRGNNKPKPMYTYN